MVSFICKSSPAFIVPSIFTLLDAEEATELHSFLSWIFIPKRSLLTLSYFTVELRFSSPLLKLTKTSLEEDISPPFSILTSLFVLKLIPPPALPVAMDASAYKSAYWVIF